MARALRADHPDTFCHVLSRGNARQAIFEDRADYDHFLEVLSKTQERFGLEVWAYVLMGNHYHLVVRTQEANLSRAMQWLGVSYGVWHNRKHDRSGHLFQGRFKSFLVDADEYLRQLILYVHRNPLRAGMVRRLIDYRWSSYGPLAYGRAGMKGFDRRRVLKLFGGSGKRLRDQVQAYSGEESRLLENLRHGLFLGGVEAWQRLQAKLSGTAAQAEKPQTQAIRRRETVEECVERWCEALGVPETEREDLRRPVRGRTRPERDMLIYLAWQEGLFSLEEIGTFFGIRYTGVVNARVRATEHLSRNAALTRRLRCAPNDK